jgi:hypothetical protein
VIDKELEPYLACMQIVLEIVWRFVHEIGYVKTAPKGGICTYESAFELAYELARIRLPIRYESVPILNWIRFNFSGNISTFLCRLKCTKLDKI